MKRARKKRNRKRDASEGEVRSWKTDGEINESIKNRKINDMKLLMKHNLDVL